MIIDGNKYIQFELAGEIDKAQDWFVVNKTSGFNLGLITWFGVWRQYVFQPNEFTEYNNSCLDTISQFLTRLNKEKRGSPPQPKE